MKIFTLFYFASGQIQGPPGSLPAGRRGVQNFDFKDAFGPPGELNLGRKEKNFSQQDIEIIYVSEKIMKLESKINPQAPVAQKTADEVVFRHFQGEGVEFFFKSDLTDPPSDF